MSPALPEAHQHALLATARVAGMAGLLVMGACTKPNTSAPEPAAPAAPAVTAAPAPPDTPAPAVATSDEELQVCRDLTVKELGHIDYGQGVERGEWTKKISAEAVACCDTLIEKGEGMGEARWGCCGVTTVADNMMACTPWGPPAPPAFA